MIETLKKNIADIIGIDKSIITETSALGKTDNWDSLKHMEIVSFIEEKYQIDLTPDDVLEMMSFSGILEVIKKNHNQKKESITLTENDFIEAFKNIGLNRGDHVFVQSSIATFGKIQNPLETIKNSFLSVISETGTLAVPTFTYRNKNFELEKSKSESGDFSEYIRLLPDALRSIHPFHSVAAIGKHSKIIADTVSKSSFSRDSVFGKMYDLDFKLCLLGTTLKDCSFFHYIEEHANVPYRFFKKITSTVTVKGSTRDFSIDYFARFREPFIKADLHTAGEKLLSKIDGQKVFVGKGPVYLVSARKLFDTTYPILLSEDPTFLINKKDKWKVQEILNGNFKK